MVRAGRDVDRRAEHEDPLVRPGAGRTGVVRRRDHPLPIALGHAARGERFIGDHRELRSCTVTFVSYGPPSSSPRIALSPVTAIAGARPLSKQRSATRPSTVTAEVAGLFSVKDTRTMPPGVPLMRSG